MLARSKQNICRHHSAHGKATTYSADLSCFSRSLSTSEDVNCNDNPILSFQLLKYREANENKRILWLTVFSFFAKNNKSTVLADRNQLLQFKRPWTLLSPVYNRTMCALTDGGVQPIGSYESCISYRELQVPQIQIQSYKAHKYRPIDRGLTLHFQHYGLNKAHYSNLQHCHSCFFDLTRSPNSVRTSAVMRPYWSKYQPLQSFNYTFAFLTEWVLSRK